MPAWKPDQSGNPSGRPRRKPVSALFDTDGLAVLDNCQDVIDSILKLMRDEKNIEDAQKKTTNFSPTFASREIQTIGDDTQKYIRFL